MRIILLGAPGSGKGTQGQILAEKLHIPQIAAGDILREIAASESELGQRIKAIMQSGALLPDSEIIAVIQNRISQDDCASGFILDGFPRTLGQAKALEENNVGIDYALELRVSEEVLVSRLTGRWIHVASGRTYHQVSNPPKQAGVDDITGEPLIQREDDKEETIRNRLKVFREQTQAVSDYYQAEQGKANIPVYVEIQGQGEIEAITKRVFEAIGY